jgi:hypothetical protein
MAKFPYLDPSKAIVQRFTVDTPPRSGPVTLKGILTYYYCSDAEGWCSRFRQPFTVTLPSPE